MSYFNPSKSLIFILLIMLVVQFSSCSHIDDLKMTFDQFIKKFKKPQLSPEEYLKREYIFYQNIGKLRKLIEDENCDFCGVTKFYDETHEEFQQRMGLIEEEKKFNDHINRVVQSNSLSNNNDEQMSNLQGSNFNPKDYYKLSALPTSKNWADEKKITSIKNQGKCGTCWSFATAAAIQSSMIIKGKFFSYLLYQPDLSQQFLLNCATFGTCSGGYLEQSIDLAFAKGIPYEYDVPYLGYKGDKSQCTDTTKNIFYSQGGTARNSYYNVSDQKIIQLLMQGPLMISISSNNWENYAGGLFRCSSTAKVDHAVLLVGFDSGKWIVKNQWGENWGEDGYIYITRDRTGNCKIGSSVHQLYGNNLASLTILLSFVLIFFFY